MGRSEDTKESHSEKHSVLQARGKERQGREQCYGVGRCVEKTG